MATASLNKVLLIGNLTRDPELKFLPSGAAVANFGIAVNRTYKGSDGEAQEDTCFLEIVAWNRLAEICGEYLAKGRPIFVEGRLQMDFWETEDGQKKSRLKVVAQNIQFLGTGAKDDTEDASDQEEGDADIPF